MSADPFERFVVAQDPLLAQIHEELRAGRKRTHWMWFVFPQIAGLGHSPTARHFALASRAEAQAYLAHPVLGPRLIDCTGLVNRHAGRSAHEMFGSPDDLKFHSCVTLFARAQPGASVFRDALDTFFGGAPDKLTESILVAERPAR